MREFAEQFETVAIGSNRMGEGNIKMKRREMMNRNEVINLIGKDRWKEFLEFMDGQTIGIGLGPKGMEADYYDEDVRNFIRKKGERFFD
jgi:predicted phage-related endonuclease